MRKIKLHLEVEEFEPLARLASELGVRPEVIVYTGLDEIMKLGVCGSAMLRNRKNGWPLS